MKKIHLIVQKSDVNIALGDLRNMETIHVEHQNTLTGEKIHNLKDKISLVKRILVGLEPFREECPVSKDKCIDCWTQKAEGVLKLISEIELFEENQIKLNILIEQWKQWGDFSPEDIRQLAEKGVFVKLYKIPTKENVELPAGALIEKISSDGKMDNCVLISRNNDELPYTRVFLPERGLEDMRKLKISEEEEINTLKSRMKEYCRCYDCFHKVLAEHEEELRFEEVACGMQEKEQLVLLKGFCPADRCTSLEMKASDKMWGLLIEDVTDEDHVPTLLRNPKWVDLIKPVFKIIDILPGYKEVDVSLVFLLFFSIFFGILIGDAGYGVIFALATMLSHLKLRKRVKDHAPFILMYVLSTCTVIWGLLTGTFFGQEWLPNTIQPLSPWVSDVNNVQMLCFIIAAIHLSIAHIWGAALKFPNLKFLSDCGWLAVIWGMYFTANMLVIGLEFPFFAKYFFFVGALLIVFFTSPNKNPLKAIGPGIGDLLMNLINSFTDIVSYIRLFAVGLATVAVADATNSMALEVGFSNVVASFLTALILVFGHVFNIILAIMAILVHGIRLNVLEFSGHLNLEWAGFKYNPFKKIANS